MFKVLKGKEERMKIINLEEFKESKELRKCENTYSRYLKSLNNMQLEIEINSLLEEFSNNSYGKDFFSRAQLLLHEIASRSEESVRNKLESMTRETFKRL